MPDAIESILAVWRDEFGLFLLVVMVVVFGLLVLAELICRNIEKQDQLKRQLQQSLKAIRQIEISKGPNDK